MDNKERIAEFAKAYVCPLNRNPTTPYELGMVKHYTAFALEVIEELGYTRPEPAESQVEAVAKILHNEERIYHSIDAWDYITKVEKESFFSTARSILKLCQPELKVLDEDEYVMISAVSEEYTCAQLKDVIREACLWQCDYDQKQIKGVRNES